MVGIVTDVAKLQLSELPTVKNIGEERSPRRRTGTDPPFVNHLPQPDGNLSLSW
jgi:hypothetical protein